LPQIWEAQISGSNGGGERKIAARVKQPTPHLATDAVEIVRAIVAAGS